MLTLLLALWASDQPPQKPPAERLEAAKAVYKAECQNLIDRLQVRLAELKKPAPNAQPEKEKERLSDLMLCEASIKNLQAQADQMPIITRLAVGTIGTAYGDKVYIVQILGKSDAFAFLNVARRSVAGSVVQVDYDRFVVRLQNFDLRNAVENKYLVLEHPVEITGILSAIGGNKPRFIVEPFKTEAKPQPVDKRPGHTPDEF